MPGNLGRERKRSALPALVSVFIGIALFIATAVFAVDLSSFELTGNPNPEIVELYQQYQDIQSQITQIENERADALSENATAMHEKEQSLENRTLTALSSAATGIGGMELARGLSEQTADSNADSDMAAYIETMRCSYGDGKSVKASLEPIELPAGDGETMTALRSEYMSLARSLKDRKESLGMAPGIESEEILDKADMGLYDDENTGITGGSYASLYRAQMMGSEKDQEKIDADKDASENRVKYGATAAGLGVVGGIVGNAIINKDAPKEQSDKINSEYDSKVASVAAESEKIEQQLQDAISRNAAAVAEYNRQLQEHLAFIADINSASPNCQELFREYIDMISALSPIENETDVVPDVTFPDINYYKSLLNQCTDCDVKGGIFDAKTGKCPCPEGQEFNASGICAEPPAAVEEDVVEQIIPVEVADEQEVIEEEATTEEVVADPNQCPATGNALKSITDENHIGDECKSSVISVGEVVWSKKKPGTCTCRAMVCTNGYTEKGGACVKEEEKPVTTQGTPAEPAEPAREYKYYNCGDTRQVPNGIKCTYVSIFSKRKVTPIEAMGLMTEWGIKNNDDLQCDTKSHRIQSDGEKYRQCASKKDENQYYEFVFSSLDSGNSGFAEALCSLWGLSARYAVNTCKKANQQQCDEISTVIDRTFYPGGSAHLKGTDCIINEHPRAQSGPISMLNETVTNDDLRTVSAVDPSYFYDKKLQINANSDLHRIIRDYMFVELKLPVKTFRCGAGFVDNTNWYNGSRQQFNDMNEKLGKCIEDSRQFLSPNQWAEQSGGVIKSCNRQYPVETLSADMMTCEYGDQKVDFMFKKLDTRWNLKSTGGYQGLWCLTEGGTFSGKSCAMASQQQCTDFNNRFKKQYPDSKGMEWDDDLGCILKDAKMVDRVQKVAETTGFVALTLVSSIAGGPIMWGLAAVESSALIADAVTEDYLNDWANAFVADAAKCAGDKATATCANAVLKKHIARVMDGSKYFNDTQNKAIAKQTQRLMEMLDDATLNAIDDQGYAALQNGQDRDSALESAIRNYYGTKLTDGEKALLYGHKAAVFFEFATIIGMGVTAGLRQAVKRNWIKLAPDRQLRWVEKWKILKPEDLRLLGTGGADAADDAARALTKSPSGGGGTGGGGAGGAGGAGGTGSGASGAGKGAGGAGGGSAGKGAGEAAGGASTGARSAGNAGDAALHADIQAFRNAGKSKAAKNNLLKKYHPDKFERFNQPELVEQAKEITQYINKIDSLNEAQLRELSQMMTEFDKSIEAAESAARAAEAAKAAEQTAKTAGGASDDVAKGTTKGAEAGDDAAKSATKGAGAGDGAATGTKSAPGAASNAGTGGGAAPAKYSVNRTVKPFANYRSGSKEANGVFEIVDNETGQILYLKRTSLNEVNMTKRAASVNLGNSSIVHVVEPVNLSPSQIDELAKSMGIVVPDYVKADTWLLTKAVPEGEDLMTVVKNGGRLRDGTKLSNAEIDQMVSELKRLKQAGVNHTDLYTNTIVHRNAAGKLEAHVIDFESAGIHDVNFIEKELSTVKTTTKGTTSTGRATGTGKGANAAGGAGKATTKAEKIAAARKSGDLGYHGTDADIAMDDMIRASSNSSGSLGNVGYGIAKDYDAAEVYAIRRLVEHQNVGKNVRFYREGNVLIIESSEPLNLTNKTGYVYTTAKESTVQWKMLDNSSAGSFYAAQMPNSVEILDKTAVNIDDLVAKGRIKIIAPEAKGTGAASSAGRSAGTAGRGTGTASNAGRSAGKGAQNIDDIATLRNRASTNFDKYLQSCASGGACNGLPYNRLTAQEWEQVNKYAKERGVELFETNMLNQKTGKYEHVMQFRRVGGAAKTRAANLYEDWKVFGKGKESYEFDFAVLGNDEKELSEFIEMVQKDGYLVTLKGKKVVVKEVFSDLLERATTEIGSPYASKKLLSATRWEELNNKISHLMLKYVDDGGGFMKLSFDSSNGAKGFVGNVGRHRVFLEKLPTASGGSSEVVNIADRAVVVVNVDGHRIPFYVSSGQAGKDALGIPSGKWYPIAGIGKDGEGWFNKMPDMMNNPVPELDLIVSKLESQFNPQLLKKYALNGRIPEAHGSAGKIINSEFKNGVVPEMTPDPLHPGMGYMDPEYKPLFDANIQHIKDIFK